MNPSKAGLVLVALAAQWALADAPLSAARKTPLATAGSADSTTKPQPGARSSGDVDRRGTAAGHIALLALNP
jgi:hypothetical protein